MPRQAEPRWHKRLKRWYARIGDVGPDGRARPAYAPATVGQADKAGAWDWFRGEVERRKAADAIPASDATVRMVCLHYLAWAEGRRAEGRLPPGEYANYVSHLRILGDALGVRPAAGLKAEDLRDLAEKLLETYAETYVRHICRTTVRAFRWAAGRQPPMAPAGIFDGFKAPTVPRMPARFAERKEAAAFIGYWRTRKPREWGRSPSDRLTLLLERCLIRTGARPKELCRLEWRHVRWDGWKTTAGHSAAKAVLPAVERVGGRRRTGHKTGGKTGKPRTIYFTPMLTRALRRVHDRGGSARDFVFVHAAGLGGRGGEQPWADGSRLSRSILRVRREMIARQEGLRARQKAGEALKPWEARLAAVEIQDEGANRLVNYRWRHTAISTLLMLGVDVPTVAELVGTSPEMIYQTYGHLLDSHLATAAEKLVSRRRPA